uniref:Uncharacterized protein n=1 Tax=Setaria viridis TaxID=4556 RepID=A0A4U6VTU2_SETVI|nr:hypothetical protein SEVIR_2G222400v2 [Setaria viridis]
MWHKFVSSIRTTRKAMLKPRGIFSIPVHLFWLTLSNQSRYILYHAMVLFPFFHYVPNRSTFRTNLAQKGILFVLYTIHVHDVDRGILQRPPLRDPSRTYI